MPRSNSATDVAVAERRPARSRATPARTTVDSLAQLQKVKADLEAVRLKLIQIDPVDLDEASRAAWEDQVDKIDLAIARARSALLSSLTAAFERELPAIQAATGELVKALQRLNKVAAVIDAVAGVLGVVEKVIMLGRS
ncbi:MAG TPA: hypothetical protein VFO28_14220 [Burkholderiaceae bacterium]|nr:hypothetical protein [Burkholderiaceae bacterium]